MNAVNDLLYFVFCILTMYFQFKQLSLPIVKETNSKKCGGNGTYECAACTCNEGYYGRHCECDSKTLSSEDYDAACRRQVNCCTKDGVTGVYDGTN